MQMVGTGRPRKDRNEDLFRFLFLFLFDDDVVEADTCCTWPISFSFFFYLLHHQSTNYKTITPVELKFSCGFADGARNSTVQKQNLHNQEHKLHKILKYINKKNHIVSSLITS